MSSSPRHQLLHASYSQSTLRHWHGEATLSAADLVYPLFISDNDDAFEPIAALPEQTRVGVNRLGGVLKPLVERGLAAVLIFGVVARNKDEVASPATDPNGPAAKAIRFIREHFPSLVVIADVCICPYSSHGHCGIFLRDDNSKFDNALTVQRLADIALFYAECGAHIVAPSDMMDGRVQAIKTRLRSKGFGSVVSVMSYSAKFASAFYGPFRAAANSAPAFGDRCKYQLPAAARGLAKQAIQRDLDEGADFVMVKPAGPYLDIVRECKDMTQKPVAIYHVSGEYAMLWHAAKAAALDLRKAVTETMLSFRRAGASVLITYFTPQLLDWLADEQGR